MQCYGSVVRELEETRRVNIKSLGLHIFGSTAEISKVMREALWHGYLLLHVSYVKKTIGPRQVSKVMFFHSYIIFNWNTVDCRAAYKLKGFVSKYKVRHIKDIEKWIRVSDMADWTLLEFITNPCIRGYKRCIIITVNFNLTIEGATWLPGSKNMRSRIKGFGCLEIYFEDTATKQWR